MKQQSLNEIKLSSKDWQAFEKMIDDAEVKPRPKLENLIGAYKPQELPKIQ